MVKKLQILKQKRSQHMAGFDRIKHFTDQIYGVHITERDFFEIKARLKKLPPIFEQFEAIQNQIELLTEFSESEDEFRTEFENEYFTVFSKLEEKIAKFETNSSSESTKAVVPSTPIQLPLMSLPSFDGEHHRWPEFRDNFLSIIDSNQSLTNVQKFYHLRSCLQPDVLETIQAIPVTNDNYKLAFERLTARYEKEYLIAGNHVNEILNFPKIIKESSVELRKLHNCLQNNLETLKNLGVQVQHWNLILIPIIAAKLDPVTFREWERFSVAQKHVNFQNLLDLINNRSEYLERINPASSKPVMDKKPSGSKNRVSSTVHVQSEVLECAICKGDHPVFRCGPFLKLGVSQRIKQAKEKGLCLNCLKTSHQLNQCPSSKCRKCGKSHNTLLHLNFDKGSNQAPKIKIEELPTVATTQAFSRRVPACQSQVILPTAMVLVVDKDEQWHRCRALLDSGAMSNFISADLQKKLNLPVRTLSCSIRGVGSSIQNVQLQTKIVFSPCHSNREQFQANCLILNKITTDLPLVSFSTENLQIPEHISLADPTFNKSNKIDLLLGSSLFWDLLKNGRIKIPNSQLILQKTKLGWVMGGHNGFHEMTSRHTHLSVNCTSVSQTNLEEQVKRFWEIEEVGEKPIRSPDDHHCENFFRQTHTRDSEGRFIVKIPFKPNVSQLGQSRQMAMKRFKWLEKRLNKDPNLQHEYSKIMKEYISMGHMKEVNDKDNSEEACYYIPHHSVTRKESLTTKTRVVFDASMPTTSGLSLNDVQHVGPTIQNDLFSILINFRLHKYVMSSDISKMYRMVLLHEEHKPFHRVFWRDRPDEPIKCFELQTVTFGTASAPFLAIRCLQQLSDENIRKFPRAAAVIQNNFYVDDLIYGSDSLDELLQIQREVTTILSSAGFYLRKWLCNDSRIYNQLKLNPELDCNTLQFGDKEHKTLGIAWNTNSDQILYSKYLIGGNPITKRTILSELSKIFDPLGLLGPILVLGKLMMQELWQKQISWDEPTPSELSNRWVNFQKELNNVHTIKIDRQVLIDDNKGFEFHGFCDASQRAYGACIIVRAYDKQGTISTKLLCSKSRVAPLKTISLPRLELSAALLLARLVHKVLDKIEIKPTTIHYWSDSTITLSWIRGNPTRWKTFVSNRVSEIQQLTDIKNWHHVSSVHNPADILSRGATTSQLGNCHLWWSGPAWLKGETITLDTNVEYPEQIPEEKISVHLAIAHTFDLIDKYSSFKKLLRITAYCLRFATNCKLTADKRKLGELQVEELKETKIILLRIMQGKAFPTEFGNLRASEPIHKQSRLLTLNPFIDNDNLIRVGGRLDKTNLAFEAKHPVVLAPNHSLTKLIAKQIHDDNFHCGPTALLSFIRQKYWPIDGRNLVKGIVRKCRVCFLTRPKPSQYLMGQLPACRATQNFPFDRVGVDYAGPILIKDRKTRNYKALKAYVCLFVCMSTKAVHLECVSDLSTEAFILCLRRFVSRRGKPSHIYSDNATNFTGANAEIKRLYIYIKQNFSNINKFLTNNEIVWHFIPARSPSFGGIWEAGIKSVKAHLNKVSKNIKFDFEELSTLLYQIEAILNSRPLTPLSSDPNDLTPLTPGHFLIGRSLNQHPEISHPSLIPTSRLKKYKQLATILSQFWKRWSRDYIHQLQIRSKWVQNTPQDTSPIQVGKLVLLRETTDPLQWPLGRIVELHPGADGVVRVVSIQVRGGIVKRGVNFICVLPEDS